jgi:site-specific DNA-methyltransferase (adenine-specific)
MPIKKEVTIGDCRLILGDCLEVMKTLDRVDCVIADPPYFEIKGGFDYIWDSFDNYLVDVDKWANQLNSLLKETGTLYWFGDEKNIAYSQVIFDKYLGLLNSLVWYKIDKKGGMFGSAGGDTVRSFPICTERLLMYSKDKYNLTTCVFEIRDYIRNEIIKSKGKLVLKDVNAALGTATNGGGVASACLSLAKTEPTMFTKEMYQKLQAWCFPELRRDYEELRREFNNHLNLTEVLEFKCEVGGNAIHPTLKPINLIKALVGTSTKPNQTILDPFMGSGTTLVACAKMGRKGIGIELDEDYFEIACKRVEEAYKSPDLFIEATKAKPVQEGFEL